MNACRKYTFSWCLLCIEKWTWLEHNILKIAILLSYDLYFLWNNLVSALLFFFILYQRYYEKVGIEYPIICLICVSQYTPQIGHEVEMFIFFSTGASKEWKEVIAGQYALSEGTTRDCIFFSVLLDGIWIVFVTGIMRLIYIVPILLWSSKHFMGTLINPKAWARYLAAFVFTLLPGRQQFKGCHCASIYKVFGKTTYGVNYNMNGEEDFFIYLCFICLFYILLFIK